MDIMHGSIGETNYYMHESFDVNAAFLTPIALLESARAFNLARNASSGRCLQRVELASMPLQYVGLMRWDELRTFTKGRSIAWPFLSTKQDQFDMFSQLYTTAGVSHLNEGGRNLSW